VTRGVDVNIADLASSLIKAVATAGLTRVESGCLFLLLACEMSDPEDPGLIHRQVDAAFAEMRKPHRSAKASMAGSASQSSEHGRASRPGKPPPNPRATARTKGRWP
jgi:hypothetical protein